MKGYNKLLNVLIVISGSFTLILYISYLIKLFIYSEGLFTLFITLSVILGVILPVVFKKLFKRLLRKTYIFFKTIYTFGMCFYMVTFISMCCFIYLSNQSELPANQLPDNTIFVVFGAGINNTQPGKSLRFRLDTAYSLMKEAPGSVCIVSGGQGKNEVVSEASVMKKYLVEKGISSDRIYMEDKSSSTIENIVFSKEVIEENNLSGYSVACISNDFHIPRIRILSDRYDFADYYYNAPSGGWYPPFDHSCPGVYGIYEAVDFRIKRCFSSKYKQNTAGEIVDFPVYSLLLYFFSLSSFICIKIRIFLIKKRKIVNIVLK